ncbi:MAG: F0F1 ATP synthase subunit gamma [Clostridiales bacterium]|nr:F0F1 ATP synthase subunit gamma [Clostridiales bacterium]MCF8022556.1 F0F1 ATP synthase subunit gamma [Clostridiales bacterium]
MASLRDLRRRIQGIKKTRQVTKAMQAVSAAKMRRAQEDVLAARPFARRVRGVLGRVGSASVGVQHPLLTVRKPEKVAYIVMTGDRGLCGAFNGNIIRKAEEAVKQHQDADLICVGRKSRDFFRKRKYNIVREYIGIGESADLELTREVVKYASDKFTDEEYDEVYLVYAEFVNALVQKPMVEKLLPVENLGSENDQGEKQEEKGARVEYIFEPDVESMLAQLLPMYVENSIFQAFLENKAGEHSARMTAMDNATKNADEMIENLTLSLNRARQAAITTEINEIVGGAAALE